MKFEEIEVGKSYVVGNYERIQTVVYIDKKLKQCVTSSGYDLEVWEKEQIDNFQPLEESDYKDMLINEFKQRFYQLTRKQIEVIIKK